jgi:hypothetical protein
MTGNELIAEFDGIAANDLDPLATTSAAKLVLLNIAARRIMHLLKIKTRSAPLVYATGTTRYNLLALSTPLSDVNRVRYNDVDYDRSDVEEDNGWCVVDQNIDIFFDVVDTEVVSLDGFLSSLPITASATSITDIPEDVQIWIAPLAIVEGCIAHEDDPSQLMRLQRMEQRAITSINRRLAKNASTAFPFLNSRR